MTTYLCVDQDGSQWITSGMPIRICGAWGVESKFSIISLPAGSIEKLLGYSLVWADWPVELEERSEFE